MASGPGEDTMGVGTPQLYNPAPSLGHERQPLLPAAPHPPPPPPPSASRRYSASGGKLRQISTSIREYVSGVRLPVYLLVSLFAIASWIDINGVWVEVPLLVNALPESWNLPSYIILITQVANIGPIIYTLANRFAPGRVKEWPVVYIIISIGASASFLLPFLWDRTTVINGGLHSTALFSLTGLLALVDCTSSVVFLPYMAIYKLQYMTAFFIGEGLSGFLPGIVGLIQGASSDAICVNTTEEYYNATSGTNYTEYVVVPTYEPPRFSEQTFFFFIFGMICVSGISFTLLHFLPYCQQERASCPTLYSIAGDTNTAGDNSFAHISSSTAILTDSSDADTNSSPHMGNPEEYTTMGTKSPSICGGKISIQPVQENASLKRNEFIISLVLVAWLNALTNGIIPSTQSYSAMPYGNTIYTLTVRLSTMANPLAALLALFLPCHSLPVQGVLVMFGTALASFQLFLAASSPFPPLKGQASGSALVIVTSLLMTGFFSYCKVSIASILNRTGGRKALLWCGGVTQIGSFVGAVTIFLLVNILKVFEPELPCQ